MKKRFAAATIAVILGIVFLFGQGAVQKVRLWDTNLSHSLLFNWNENDTAGRTLNWLVGGADRSFTISGDSYIDQDVRIAATPYHAGLYLSSSSVAPFLKLTNASDTERDPIIQFAVGATPVVKFTHGLDDSDDDNLSWCNDDALVDTTEVGFGNFLGIIDTGVSSTIHRIKSHLCDDTLAHISHIHLPSGSGDNESNAPLGICTDMTYYYITDTSNNRIKKHRITDGLFMWAIGTVGTGDDQFANPKDICTDGIYLYVTDKGNCRIKKHLCSTGAYVAKLGSYGTALGQFITPTGICTDGIYLYITEGDPGNAPPLKKHLCSTLAGVSQLEYGDGHLDSTNCQGICTDGTNLWLTNANNSALSAIFKYSTSLVYVSEYGNSGSGDTEFNVPWGICTDNTHLYIVDTNNSRIKKHLISSWGFVAKIGSYGDGDDQFSAPYGICTASMGNERRGRLLRLHEDGTFFDVWPKLSLYSTLVFREDSIAQVNYVEIKPPTSITSYTLILPGVAAGAKKHLFSGATGILDWGQNVDADGSPTFVTVKLSGLTDGYIPYHVDDATGLANSPILVDVDDVSIGGAIDTYANVHIYGKSASGAYTTLTVDLPIKTISANEFNSFAGLSFSGSDLSIASGKTDSGQRYGGLFQCYVADANFQGTLSNQYGLYLLHGLAYCGTSATPTITNSYGLYLEGLDSDGTITNKWGVYQVNANFKNYFQGNVGIGTTAPGYKLDISDGGVSNGANIRLGIGTGGGLDSKVLFAGGRAVVGYISGEVVLGDGGNAKTMSLQTSGVTRLMIYSTGNINFNDGQIYVQQSSGNVGIGTTSPSTALHLSTAAAASEYLRINGPDTQVKGLQLYSNNNALDWEIRSTATSRELDIGKTGGGGFLHIQREGNVGINDTAPAEKLDVTGNINCTLVYKVADTQVVGARGAAVADATDAASVILRLNDLLARCRAHGLIAN